jgi:hypothetical protein
MRKNPEKHCQTPDIMLILNHAVVYLSSVPPLPNPEDNSDAEEERERERESKQDDLWCVCSWI